MALDKAIDSAQLDADLTAVADAIRAKGGTSDALAFPSGFVEAVEAIQAGGGDSDSLLSRLNNTITTYTNSTLTSLNDYSFASCTNLESVSLEACTSVGDWAFFGCSKLSNINLPNLKSVSGTNTFKGCKLTDFRVPKYEASIVQGMFVNCKSLKCVDMGFATGFGWDPFNGCSALDTLILRRDALVSLPNASFLSSTQFKSSGNGGIVYVPQALIAQYEVATNWSTYVEYGTLVFTAIEGSEYE